ncbi:MAG: Calx-beta domain-containing protein, partial [Pseudomonadota bacterium]
MSSANLIAPSAQRSLFALLTVLLALAIMLPGAQAQDEPEDLVFEEGEDEPVIVAEIKRAEGAAVVMDRAKTSKRYEFDIDLDLPPDEPFEVEVYTQVGETGSGAARARPGVDFVSQTAKVVRFAPGEITKKASIEILPGPGSEIREGQPAREFGITVVPRNMKTSEQVNRQIAAQNTLVPVVRYANSIIRAKRPGVGEVEDDVRAVVEEGDAGERQTLNFKLELDSPALDDVNIVIDTFEDSTAVEGLDYELPQKTITIEEGQTEVNLPVVIIGDDSDESRESLNVLLNIDPTTDARVRFPQGALDTVIEIAIKDDDQGAFKVDDIVAGEAEGSAQLRLTLPKKLDYDPEAGAVTALLQYRGGTAGLGPDFTLPANIAVFESNRAALEIGIVDDAIEEATESADLEVILTQSGKELAKAQSKLTIFDDDNLKLTFKGNLTVEGLGMRAEASATFKELQKTPTGYTATFEPGSGTVRLTGELAIMSGGFTLFVDELRLDRAGELEWLVLRMSGWPRLSIEPAHPFPIGFGSARNLEPGEFVELPIGQMKWTVNYGNFEKFAREGGSQTFRAEYSTTQPKASENSSIEINLPVPVD